jgi:hypothetical protein
MLNGAVYFYVVSHTQLLSILLPRPLQMGVVRSFTAFPVVYYGERLTVHTVLWLWFEEFVGRSQLILQVITILSVSVCLVSSSFKLSIEY